MRLSEPSWWYRDAPTWQARALAPLAWAWGVIAERRYRHGAAFRSPLPVICIGNFTAGGTGKTPLALVIARQLLTLGREPVFLTRGYGGKIAGPHWVSPDRDAASEVGDEPLLLALVAPTLICSDRAEGARVIAARTGDRGAIVMDDGLQNGDLAKDVVFAVVDGRRGIGNGRVIPAGPLRAPLGFQLSLADAVVVNTPDGGAGREAPHRFLDGRFRGPVLKATTRAVGETSWIGGGPLVAFSGIGAPERFFGLVERLGGRILERHAFPDHHVFTEADLRQLLDAARRLGATLCTTEKDWVRLASDGVAGELRGQTKVLAVSLELEEHGVLELRRLLEASFVARSGLLP